MAIQCKECGEYFDIHPADVELLQKFEVPAPSLCSFCRHQRRAMFIPALHFKRRESALSGEPLLSVYSQSAVYSIAEWWTDAWDGADYGRGFDFSQAFFPQFATLFRQIPKMANQNEGTENCDYCYSAHKAKNCYYCQTVTRSEDIYYSEMVTGNNSNCVDCLKCQRSSLLYECIRCFNCHSSSFLSLCTETRDSHYCFDCQGCADCIFCSNLRNKTGYAFNENVGSEAVKQLTRRQINGSATTLRENIARFRDVQLRAIHKALQNVSTEHCFGDGLVHCARCYDCFDSLNCVDCRYCWGLSPSEQCVSSMDLTKGGTGELLYNCTGMSGGNYSLRCCARCRQCSNLSYCIDCYSCKDCFGCTGLRSKQYCILNQQLNREEYESALPKIIAALRSTGEWGEFFPPEMAPIAYNRSYASIYFPLSQEQAAARGWWWDEEEQRIVSRSESVSVPDQIADADDSLCEQALVCVRTGRPYKIIKSELDFYRKMRLPIPRLHPEARMADRRASLNPFRLWSRNCAKCGGESITSYAPDRPEIIYCQECYLQAVY